MKDDLLLVAIGAVAGAAAVTTDKLRHLLATDSDASRLVLAEVRQRLAEALDRLRDAQAGNDALRATIAEYFAAIAERDATIAQMQQERARCDQSIIDLIKALNAANSHCASLRSQLSRCGEAGEGSYFMFALEDGSIAGPFSRS